MRTFIIVCGATIAMTAGYAHALPVNISDGLKAALAKSDPIIKAQVFIVSGRQYCFTSTDGTAQAGIDAVMHFEVGLAGEALMAGGDGDMCRRSDASGNGHRGGDVRSARRGKFAGRREGGRRGDGRAGAGMCGGGGGLGGFGGGGMGGQGGGGMGGGGKGGGGMGGGGGGQGGGGRN